MPVKNLMNNHSTSGKYWKEWKVIRFQQASAATNRPDLYMNESTSSPVG
jgi:hypothetical protein